MHRRTASERVRVRVRMSAAALGCSALLGGGAHSPPHSVVVPSVCVLPLTNSCLRVDGSVGVECGCGCAMPVQRDPWLSGRRGPSGRLRLLLDRIGSTRLDSLRLDSKQSVTNGNRVSGLVGRLFLWCRSTEQRRRHEEHAHHHSQKKITDTLTRPDCGKEEDPHEYTSQIKNVSLGGKA